jgi:hypothetical protein
MLEVSLPVMVEILITMYSQSSIVRPLHTILSFVSNERKDTYPNSALHIPLLHGGDVLYTFYDLPPSPENPAFNIDVAEQWQLYILGFALESNPNYFNPSTNITKYGDENKVIKFDYKDIASEVSDPFAGIRCDSLWPTVWQEYGEYEPPGRYNKIDVKAKVNGKSRGKPQRKPLSNSGKGREQDVLALGHLNSFLP